jgi:hypothetical protein
MMRPPLGTVEKYTFKSTGMGMTTGGRTSSADPSLKVASNSDGMKGMNMRAQSSDDEDVKSENKKNKRQMGGMMSMKDAAWTHAMHIHLVASHNWRYKSWLLLIAKAGPEVDLS